MGSLAKIATVAPVGFEGNIVEVESDQTRGLPSLQIVGLANKSIDEAKERVRSAISNSLMDYPAKRITINLAPAELPKYGTHYDLPIALAILTSSGQLRQTEVEGAVFAGELALDGSIRPISGAISIAECAKISGYDTLYLPVDNAQQAALVSGLTIYRVKSLKEIFLHLKQEAVLQPHTGTAATKKSTYTGPLIDDVKGQQQAKRALEIAAAGHHNLLLSGPPGAGKTMLARIVTDLMPDLSEQEQLAVTKLHSLAGEAIDDVVTARPFRAPHHSASRASLIGGGTKPSPGEVSLAHCGILFLDEIPEYPRTVLEALRQPLEDRFVTVTRAGGRASYPADFLLVATMNPCPCGYFGDDTRECQCSSVQIQNYQKRISGPFLDRIDMKLTVGRVPSSDILESKSLTNSHHKSVQKNVAKARTLQSNRYNSSVLYNGNVDAQRLKDTMQLTPEARSLLEKATEKMQLSARSVYKTLRTARTIADLDTAASITPNHIAEALQYR